MNMTAVPLSVVLIGTAFCMSIGRSGMTSVLLPNVDIGLICFVHRSMRSPKGTTA